MNISFHTELERIVEDLQEEKYKLMVNYEKLDSEKSFEINEILNNLKQLEGKIETLESSCTTLSQTNEELQNNIENLTQAYQKTLTDYHNSTTELDKINHDVITLTQQNEDLNSNSQVTIEELNTKIELLSKESDNTREMYEQEKLKLHESIQELTENFESQSLKLEQIEIESNEYQSNISELNEKVNELTTEKEELNKSLEEIQEKCSTFEENVSKINEEKCQIENKLQQQNQELQRTSENEILILQAKVEEVSSVILKGR